MSRRAAPWLHPAFAVGVGAAAGTVSGLLGVGGGLVIGPTLALCGMALPRALGTALTVVVPVAAAGVVAELLFDSYHLHWGAALAVAVGGQLGAPLGAQLLVKMSERALRALFSAFLIYFALRNLGVLPGDAPGAPLPGVAGGRVWLAALFAALSGVAGGMSASLFGIGGGVVVVPCLIYLSGGFDFHSAAGTSLLAMVPTAARGAWIADRQGRVERRAAWYLSPAAVACAALAVWYRNQALSPAFLAHLFGVFLLLVAVQLARPRGRRAR